MSSAITTKKPYLTIINNMREMFMEVYCEGLSPQEMNAVKGGTASPLCTCLKTDASRMRPPH